MQFIALKAKAPTVISCIPIPFNSAKPEANRKRKEEKSDCMHVLHTEIHTRI